MQSVTAMERLVSGKLDFYLIKQPFNFQIMAVFDQVHSNGGHSIGITKITENGTVICGS